MKCARMVAMTAALAGLIFTTGVSNALSQGSQKAELVDSLSKEISIEQNLNTQVDLSLQFRDENGKEVRLGEYFGQEKPVLLMLVYYGCPMLCGQVMQGAVRGLKEIPLEIGQDYEIVTVSIDPGEDAELATMKKHSFVRLMNRDGAEQGWHFLTGDSANIKKLADQVGFRYYYDEGMGQYAHSAGIMMLTPTGVLSKYLYGIEYDPQDLRLGLVEASENKIGSVADQLLLLCYQYNPMTGSYGFVITNALKVAGSLTFLVLGGFIFFSIRREKGKKSDADSKA